MKPSALLKHRWADSEQASKYPIVEVLWLDATGVWAEDWGDASDIEKAMPARTVTVGYLVKNDADRIVVVAMCNDSHVGLGLVIPKGMVKQVRYLVWGNS